MNARNMEVAKFGGTSMANIDIVLGQLNHSGNEVNIVVTSAPGKDDDYQIKTTDMLLDYARSPHPQKINDIQDRIAAAAEKITSYDSGNQELEEIIDEIPRDISDWRFYGNPIQALGEYWSARILASMSDYKFVDARELVRFDAANRFDEEASYAAVKARLSTSGQKYVIPGYYGIRPDRRIAVFDRGGSDTTGAALSLFLDADKYHVWSDVDGFMSADPRKVADARLIPEVTYREARELGNGGSELLNRTSIKILGNTATKTLLRNTFGSPDNIGTTVSKSRDWSQNPVIAVTARADLLELTVHEFGLHEAVGTTVPVYQQLQKNNIPYEHTATATDDVAIFLAKEYKNGIKKIASRLHNLSYKDAGMVHIVGEGLARSGTERFRVIGKVASAFADANIAELGFTDVAGSGAMSIFIDPSSVPCATLLAHQTLELGR